MPPKKPTPATKARKPPKKALSPATVDSSDEDDAMAIEEPKTSV